MVTLCMIRIKLSSVDQKWFYSEDQSMFHGKYTCMDYKYTSSSWGQKQCALASQIVKIGQNVIIQMVSDTKFCR